MGKVPSIEKLRKICQRPKKRPDGFYGSLIENLGGRWISIYLTKLLLYTSISANQVTLISLFIALIGMCFFLWGKPQLFLVGAIFLLIYNIFDLVDGEIARYRDATSPEGLFLDRIARAIMNSGRCIFIMIGIYQRFTHISVVLIGCIATLSMVVKIHLHMYIDTILYQLIYTKEHDFLNRMIEENSKITVSKNKAKLFNKYLFSFSLHRLFLYQKKIYQIMNKFFAQVLDDFNGTLLIFLCAMIDFILVSLHKPLFGGVGAIFLWLICYSIFGFLYISMKVGHVVYTRSIQLKYYGTIFELNKDRGPDINIKSKCSLEKQ